MLDRRQSAERRGTDDRRDDGRICHDADVRVLKGGRRSVVIPSAKLRDISASGLRLCCDTPLEVGDRLLIEVRLEDCYLNLSAAICRVFRTGDSCEAGCEFSKDLTFRQLERLRRSVRDSSAAGRSN